MSIALDPGPPLNSQLMEPTYIAPPANGGGSGSFAPGGFGLVDPLALLAAAPSPMDSAAPAMDATLHGPASEPYGEFEESAPGASTLSGQLLRGRLTAAAWVLLGLTSLLFLRAMFEHMQRPQWVHAGVLVLLIGLAVLLTGRRQLSNVQLRLIELVMFGTVGSHFVDSLLRNLLQAAKAGDASALHWSVAAGTMGFAALVMSYGMFMPNGWRRTLLMVTPPALAPVGVMSLVCYLHPFVAEAFPLGRLLEMTAILAICTTVSVYGNWIIAELRQEVRRARKFGQYRLKRRIGIGGMGEVFLAEHCLLKRPCAIKLIRPNHVTDPMALLRFEREVHATARLSHWHTVEIYDYGHTEDGTFYYVMEYLPGMNLNELVLRFGPMPASRVIHFLAQTCDALQEAHEHGLVHRDLKPANIFSANRGGIYDVSKLLDFGLVEAEDLPSTSINPISGKRTIAGSPLYMAPEQAANDSALDPRCDLYSLGATGYFLLTGRPPFEGATPMKLFLAHARDTVIPPSHYEPSVPPDLEAVILRCLEKQPEDRYHSARELRIALRQCVDAYSWNAEIAEEWWTTQAPGHFEECTAEGPANHSQYGQIIAAAV